MNAYLKSQKDIAIVILIMTISGCDQNQSSEGPSNTVAQVKSQVNDIQEITTVSTEDITEDQRQFNIGNTQYLFDISNHSPDEMEALLYRAEEIRETHAEGYEDLEIVLVLHGPDINIFRQENYSKHKPLVDLAAKLDAFDIIDMKICETTMSSMGVDRSEVPAFIESVPFAPAEIRRLGEEGYINL